MFKKGDLVFVTGTVVGNYPYHNRYNAKNDNNKPEIGPTETIIAEPKEHYKYSKALVRLAQNGFFGIVIGLSRRAVGYYTPGSRGDMYEDYEPNGLDVTGWIPVWVIEPLGTNDVQRYYEPVTAIESDITLAKNLSENTVIPIEIYNRLQHG